MRAPAVALAVLALAPLAAAASDVEVRGTLAGWVLPHVEAAPGDTVRFTSVEAALGVEHPAFIDGLLPDGGAFGATTTYSDVPEGTWDFVCGNHAWMTGRLVVG